MLPLPRPPRLRARPLRGLRGWGAATLVITLMMALAGSPPAWAAEGQRAAKPRVARAAGASANGGAAAAGQTDARRAAQVEAGNIAELRSRMTSRDLALLRRADMGDARIDVWLYQPSRQYYVSVSMQGSLRRTLKPVNEAEAWLNFDSFRRLAALGDVGRPVLLGQLNAGATGNAGAGGDAGSNAGAGSAGMGSAGIGNAGTGSAGIVSPGIVNPGMASAGIGGSAGPGAAAPSPGAAPALRPGGQDLRTVPVPRERLAADDEVDEMDLERVRQAREAYATSTGGAAAGTVMSTGTGTGAGTGMSANANTGGGRGLVPTPAVSAVSPSRQPAQAQSTAAATEASTVVGQAVETLRRERIGDDVARLVWSADSGQFTASLTRQGRVVDMLRSPDRQAAVAAFDDLVRQARARAVASAAH